MGKRTQTRRKASARSSRFGSKEGSNSSASETGHEEALGTHTERMMPIERMFVEEMGREMEPEERRILLGIYRRRRKPK